MTPWGCAPCIKSPEKGSRCGGLLWLNSLGSVYCDELCLALSLRVCLAPSLSLLQPPGPDRVHCSLHGNCIMLSVPILLSFSELPTPPHSSYAVAVFFMFPLLQHPPLILFMHNSLPAHPVLQWLYGKRLVKDMI